MFIEFRTVKNGYTVLLQIHSGNCLQKNGIQDLSLIKLLQNEQGCNFFASQCSLCIVISFHKWLFRFCVPDCCFVISQVIG